MCDRHCSPRPERTASLPRGMRAVKGKYRLQGSMEEGWTAVPVSQDEEEHTTKDAEFHGRWEGEGNGNNVLDKKPYEGGQSEEGERAGAFRRLQWSG